MLSRHSYKAELANRPNVRGSKDLSPMTSKKNKIKLPIGKRKFNVSKADLISYSEKYMDKKNI